jgi:hypothetical protein
VRSKQPRKCSGSEQERRCYRALNITILLQPQLLLSRTGVSVRITDSDGICT